MQKDYLKLYKTNSVKNEKFLSETCNFFLEKKLIPKINEKFIIGNIPSSDRTVNKLNKLCVIDGNMIYIPYEEMTDIINFSIFVERQQFIDSTNEKKVSKINTFSELLENGINDEVMENKEETFDVEDVKNFIIESSKLFCSDVVEKNQKIVLTFS